MTWTSSILDTAHCADLSLRARDGLKVEVLGTTSDGVGVDVQVLADVIVIADGALLTIPISLLRRVKTEGR